MTSARKIGIILIIVGICLPTATLPFITEFHPLPNICLTSNFFGNLGNMIIAIGSKQMNMSGADVAATYSPLIAIPYRYVFALGVILFCAGMGTIILSSGNTSSSRQ